MKRLAFLAAALLAGSMTHAEPGPARAQHFERVRALELKALAARSDILAHEQACSRAALDYAQLKACRQVAQAARDALSKELRPQYEALAPRTSATAH